MGIEEMGFPETLTVELKFRSLSESNFVIVVEWSRTRKLYIGKHRKSAVLRKNAVTA
jgi:hypothetical protein